MITVAHVRCVAYPEIKNRLCICFLPNFILQFETQTNGGMVSFGYYITQTMCLPMMLPAPTHGFPVPTTDQFLEAPNIVVDNTSASDTFQSRCRAGWWSCTNLFECFYFRKQTLVATALCTLVTVRKHYTLLLKTHKDFWNPRFLRIDLFLVWDVVLDCRASDPDPAGNTSLWCVSCRCQIWSDPQIWAKTSKIVEKKFM